MLHQQHLAIQEHNGGQLRSSIDMFADAVLTAGPKVSDVAVGDKQQYNMLTWSQIPAAVGYQKQTVVGEIVDLRPAATLLFL